MSFRFLRHVAVRARGALAALVLGCAVVSASVGAPEPAFGATLAQVAGRDMSDFGRMLFQFGTTTKTAARVTGSVLVISFDNPLEINADRLPADLAAYVAVVRKDPDGRALRFALKRRVTVNVMEAGDKTFVDLLPDTWKGRPPGLPQDIVDEIALRMRIAETKVRELTVQREATPPSPLLARVARLPTLTRIVLTPPDNVLFRVTLGEKRVDATFDAPLTLDLAQLRKDLPDDVAVSMDVADGRLKVGITGGLSLDAFREDGTAVIDVTRGPSSPAKVAAVPSAPRPAAPVADGKPPVKPATTPASAEAAGPSPASVDQATHGPAAAAAATAPSNDKAPVAAASAEGQAPPPAADTGATPPPSPSASPLPVQPVIGRPVRAAMTVDGSLLRIRFPFRAPTAAAAWVRGRQVTVVFDTPDRVLPVSEDPRGAPLVLSSETYRIENAAVVRFDLARADLARLAPDGQGWTLILGDDGQANAGQLSVERGAAGDGRSAVLVSGAQPGIVHWMDDPVVGDRLAVVPAFGAPMGLAKPYRFVELTLLPSLQGVVASATADDVVVRSERERVSLSRAAGLTVTGAEPARAADTKPLVLGREAFAALRTMTVLDRWRALALAAATASDETRGQARQALAIFLTANDLGLEAGSVFETLAKDDPDRSASREIALWRMFADVGVERFGDARRRLEAPSLVDDPEAALWRAALDAKAGQWKSAAAGFARAAPLLDRYPERVQALLRPSAVEAGLETRDIAAAERELARFQAVVGDAGDRAEAMLLTARLAEAKGQIKPALAAYGEVAAGEERPQAAEAVWRGTDLGLRAKVLKPDEAIASLEVLTMTWRGGEAEIESLGLLGKLYMEAGRWRDAFQIARRADDFFPDSEISRRLHDDTAVRFETLFLTGAGDSLDPVAALALYYDFKEFTPIGRRGDEMIRHLAERLTALDLIDQAADLLQYQVDRRLTGAARAIVATRLAAMRLMSGKPVDALKALQATRLPDLPQDVMRARLLLQARALGEQGRTDLAIDILDGDPSAEVARLKADILWAGKRWREASEAFEQLAGDAWRGPQPLADRARQDIQRAAIGYALANEDLSLDRLKTKFSAKMAQTPDSAAFDFLTRPGAATANGFGPIARSVTSAGSLSAFMADYRKRYPDMAPAAPAAEASARPPAGPA